MPGERTLERQEKLFVNWLEDQAMFWQECTDEECEMYGSFECDSIRDERRYIYDRGHYSLLGSNWSAVDWDSHCGENIMHFGVPGPHFLHLLETIPLEVGGGPDGKDDESKDEELCHSFDDMAFKSFMDTFNFRLVSVKNGRVTRLRQGFPKELIWYYGVDKFAIRGADSKDEENEEEGNEKSEEEETKDGEGSEAEEGTDMTEG